MTFFSELKRRNVFRVGAAYVVVAWLLIQVAETIFPLFGFDATPARIVVIVLTVGFIPAVIFSWVYELTAEGLIKEKDVDRSQSVTYATGRKLDFAIPTPGRCSRRPSSTARRSRRRCRAWSSSARR